MKPDKTPRGKIPPAVRQYVLDRDNNRCQSCGTTETLTIDHIIALSLGGPNDVSNFQTLCQSCNSRKRYRPDDRFQRHFT